LIAVTSFTLSGMEVLRGTAMNRSGTLNIMEAGVHQSTSVPTAAWTAIINMPLVVWHGKATGYTSYYQVWYAKYNGSWSTPVRISTYSGMDSNNQYAPSIAVDTNDYLRVMWRGKATGYTDYEKVWYTSYESSWGTPECLQPTGQNRFPNIRWSRYPPSNRVLDRVDYVFISGTSSPYNITFDVYILNMAPNATLVTPADGARFDPGESVTFTWNYSDPEGDPQDAYRFQLDDDAGFGSPEIDTGKVSSSGNSTTQSLPSTPNNYYWRVRTWDAYGSVGSWSAARSIQAWPPGPIVADVETTPSTIRRNDPTWLNVTIRHINGTAAIKNATITLEDITNQTITFTWTAAGDTYAEASDPDNIGLLGTNSTTITVNSTTLKLCFNITITAAAAGDLNATVTAYDTDDDPGTYNTLLNYEYYNWNTAVYDIINSAYEFFDPLNNYVDALGDIKDLVSSLSAYWLTSITNMITLVALQFTIVLNVINWLTAPPRSATASGTSGTTSSLTNGITWRHSYS